MFRFTKNLEAEGRLQPSHKKVGFVLANIQVGSQSGSSGAGFVLPNTAPAPNWVRFANYGTPGADLASFPRLPVQQPIHKPVVSNPRLPIPADQHRAQQCKGEECQ